MSVLVHHPHNMYLRIHHFHRPPWNDETLTNNFQTRNYSLASSLLQFLSFYFPLAFLWQQFLLELWVVIWQRGQSACSSRGIYKLMGKPRITIVFQNSLHSPLCPVCICYYSSCPHCCPVFHYHWWFDQGLGSSSSSGGIESILLHSLPRIGLGQRRAIGWHPE